MKSKAEPEAYIRPLPLIPALATSGFAVGTQEKVVVRQAKHRSQHALIACTLVSVSAFCLMIITLACLGSPASARDYEGGAEGILSLDYTDGKLSLETKDASLDKVLEELSRLAEFDIVSDGPLEGQVTVYIRSLPPDKAVKKLLRGKDLSLIYRSQPDSLTEQYLLEEVRIYLSKGKKGQERRYSPPVKDSSYRPSASSSRPRRTPKDRHRPKSSRPRKPPDSILSAGVQGFMSGMMTGDPDSMDEAVDRMREEHPEFQEHIDNFVESLEEAKAKAEESGVTLPPMEEMGNMGLFMERMMKNQKPD